MNQVSITDLKKLKVAEIKAQMPFQVTSDGQIIGVMQGELKLSGKTKCPNCKLVYDYTPDDGKPFYFTMRHQKS